MLISAFLIFLLYFMYLLCIYSSIYEMLKIKSKNSSQFTLSRAFCFLFFKNSFILLLNIISASYPVRRSKQISCKIPQFLHRQKLRNNHSLQISAYCPLVIFSRSSGLHSTCVPILPPLTMITGLFCAVS